ncbi:MAG: hypothetical protein ACOCY0_04920 [Roseicyclus sp.]
MAYYASEGRIGTAPTGDCIEITAAQYAEGLDGIAAGRRVTIAGGAFAVVDADGVPQPSPEPATLVEAQATARDEIDTAYVACLERGVAWGGARWTADDRARDTLFELLHAAALQEPVTVLDAAEAARELSAADLEALRDAGLAYRQAARARRLALRGEVAAAGTVADVEAIDTSSGWPG